MYRSLLIFAVHLAISATIFAQKIAPKTMPEPVNPVCNREFARSMAEQMTSESQIFTESDQRIKILLRTAEFLWEFAPEDSRLNFQKAFDLARERFKEKGIEKVQRGNATANVSVLKPDLRSEVIRAMAKREANLAKKMSETLLKDNEELSNKRNEFGENAEAQILQSLAVDLAKSNPEAALNFARRAIPTATSQSWTFTLYQIARENMPLSDQLYGEVLAASTNKSAQELLMFSLYPFASNRPLGVGKFMMSANVPPNLVPNQNLQHQFLQVFINRAASFETEEKPEKSWHLPDTVYAFSGLNDAEPIVRERFPDLLERLQTARVRVQTLMSEESQKTLQTREERNKKSQATFAEKLKQLEESDANGKLKDYDIVNLILYTEKEDDLKQLESWLIKFTQTVRESAVNLFWFKRAKTAVKEKRLDDAQKFADKVPEIEHRAVLYFDIAEAKLIETKDKFQAAQILSEVVKVASKAEDSVEKAQAQLGTAFLFTKLDRFRALELAGDAVKTANKLENPDLFTSSVSQQIIGKDFAIMSVYDTPGFDLEKTFGKIAEKDLDNILSISRNFTDRYIRTVAVLAVVKNCREIEKKAPRRKLKT